MIIGVPKEIMENEGRVALIPESVEKLVDSGHSVLVEKNAGKLSHNSDEEYVKAGAKIVSDTREIFNQADVIFKVKEPIFNKALNIHEIDLLKPGSYLMTFLHPASPVNWEKVKKMAAKNIIALTMDGVPRIARAQSMDALSSMSTVAGYKAVIIAANMLPKFMCEMSTAAGAVEPAKVFVIGMGVVGIAAAETAKRLGAEVTIYDIRSDVVEKAESLGVKVHRFQPPQELVKGEHGSVKYLPKEWRDKERESLKSVLAESDVVILGALVLGHRAPVIVTEEMAKSMHPGSIIMDVAIDQGGNCELAKAGETLDYNGVLIDGTKNIPGSVPVHSSMMYSRNIYNLFDYLLKDGKIHLDTDDEIVRGILVCKDGKILHEGALQAMSEEK